MNMSLREHNILLQRTCDIHRQQRSRALAAGECIDYSVDDLRVYVRNNLGARNCYYCLGPVTVENFALVPKNPPERGGSYAFHNLTVTCAMCAAAKGVLDYIEYRELIGLVNTWSPFVRRNLLARLEAAAHVRDGLEFLPNPRLLAQAQ